MSSCKLGGRPSNSWQWIKDSCIPSANPRLLKKFHARVTLSKCLLLRLLLLSLLPWLPLLLLGLLLLLRLLQHAWNYKDMPNLYAIAQGSQSFHTRRSQLPYTSTTPKWDWDKKDGLCPGSNWAHAGAAATSIKMLASRFCSSLTKSFGFW